MEISPQTDTTLVGSSVSELPSIEQEPAVAPIPQDSYSAVPPPFHKSIAKRRLLIFAGIFFVFLIGGLGAVLYALSYQQEQRSQASGGETQLSGVGVYDRQNGSFVLANPADSSGQKKTLAFGPAGSQWIPVAGDWTGAKQTAYGLFDPATGTFHLNTNATTPTADTAIQLILPPASSRRLLPVAGDWTGKGISSIGVYDQVSGTFYLRNSNTSGAPDLTFNYGPPNNQWLPMAGDWTGQHITTIGLYDPHTRSFYLRYSNTAGNADLTIPFGPADNKWLPLTIDNSLLSGKSGVGLYDPATGVFYLRNNNNTSGVADQQFGFGIPGQDTWPVAGAWAYFSSPVPDATYAPSPTLNPNPPASPTIAPVPTSIPNPLIVDLLGRQSGFPVLLNRSGINQIECTPLGYQSNQNTDPWLVEQYTNDVSLCTGPTAQSTFCPGATTVFGTASDRFCYFNNTQTAQFTVDTQSMHDKGCYVSQRPDNLKNPGGYGITLQWNAQTARPDFWDATYPNLNQLSSLLLSARVSTDSYTQGVCPAIFSDGKLAPDPGLKTTEPSAFTYLYVTATQLNPKTQSGGNTIYYQVVTYDSRTGPTHHQTKNNPNQPPTYLNCKLPSSGAADGFIVAGDTVEYYGYNMANKTPQDYRIDVLPRLKYFINKCLGSSANINNYKITGFTFGNELQNTANISNTVTSPSMQFMMK